MKFLNKDYRLPFLLFIAVILAWIATMYLVPFYHPDNPGIFGDMFGSINALFSGLAFVGIIVTILFQSKELSLQREELKATREVLKKQAFENTFFQLLKTFNEIVYNINNIQIIATNDSLISSHRKLGSDFSDMSASIQNLINSQPNYLIEAMSETEKLEKINSIYIDFYNKFDLKLGTYFRLLYNMIKFVDTSNETNKKFYVDIIRAQLSSPELSLIYYNCISDKGKDKLAPLVVKYNLLKHMPQNEITEKIKLS